MLLDTTFLFIYGLYCLLIPRLSDLTQAQHRLPSRGGHERHHFARNKQFLLGLIKLPSDNAMRPLLVALLLPHLLLHVMVLCPLADMTDICDLKPSSPDEHILASITLSSHTTQRLKQRLESYSWFSIVMPIIIIDITAAWYLRLAAFKSRQWSLRQLMLPTTILLALVTLSLAGASTSTTSLRSLRYENGTRGSHLNMKTETTALLQTYHNWHDTREHTTYDTNSSAFALVSTTRSGSSSKSSSSGKLELVIDSGASFHIHPFIHHLNNVRSCTYSVSGVDRKSHSCTRIGDLPITVRGGDGRAYNITIPNVRCIPTFKDSLISVQQLWKDCKVDTQFRDQCVLVTSTGKHLPFDANQRGLFVWTVLAGHASRQAIQSLTPASTSTDANHSHRMRFADPADSTNSPTQPAPRALSLQGTHSSKTVSHIAALSPDVAAAHMHRRLHIGVKSMQRLPSITSDAPPNLARARVNACPACVTANAPHHSHTARRYAESYPGRLIHADIAGPFIRSRIGGFHYLLVLVDDHSRFKFAYPLVARRDAPAIIRRFIASFNALASRPGGSMRCVGTLHTDGAGEFTSHKFRDELADSLINKSESPPEVHALNGVAERAIRSIFSHVRADLAASAAPKSFWPEATDHAVDILNRTTCPPHGRCTAHEALTGEKPRVMSLWPWGCRAWAVQPTAYRRKTSLGDMALCGIHLGRTTSPIGSYRIWVPEEGRMVNASDVYFDETLFPWRPAGDRRVDDPHNGFFRPQPDLSVITRWYE